LVLCELGEVGTGAAPLNTLNLNAGTVTLTSGAENIYAGTVNHKNKLVVQSNNLRIHGNYVAEDAHLQFNSGSFAVIGNTTLNKGFTVTANYNGSVPTLDFSQSNLTNNLTSASLTLNVN
jgi:hypothetical protein